MNLNGKTAVVTGAATDIGAAIAAALAAHGAVVVGLDRLWREVDALPGVVQLQCDVTERDSVRHCMAHIQEHYGQVNILINNAALSSDLAPTSFDNISAQEWTRVLTENTLGPFLCSQAVTSGMREKKWGRIINLTSATIFTGQPLLLHYIASKGAIASMTRSLARELGADGITVNAIAPGLTMTKNMAANPAYTPEVIEQAVKDQCIPRQEQAQDLVGVCLFLVSDGASMMTGQVLAVDGGTAVH